MQLGLVLSRTNRPEAAANIYRQVLKENPGFAECYNNLGQVLLQSKGVAPASEAFGQALKIKPDYAEAFQLAPHLRNLVQAKP
jgi:cytochrome c-type biogenesis protein CcmH/NrfG